MSSATCERDDELALRLEQAVDTWRKGDHAVVVDGHRQAGRHVRVLFTTAKKGSPDVVSVEYVDSREGTWFFANNLVRLPKPKGT